MGNRSKASPKTFGYIEEQAALISKQVVNGTQ